MRYINNSSVHSISFGKFTSNRYFEVRRDKGAAGGWAVEFKGFGKQLRWYPGYSFFFIRSLA